MAMAMAGLALAVGERVASTFICKLIDKARSYLGDNYDSHTSIKAKLYKLEATLPQIEAAIEFADGRPIQNKGLNNWLRQLKDAYYEADDVLDEFELKILREKAKGRNQVSELASSTLKTVKHVLFSSDDIRNLKHVVEKLENIASGVGPMIEMLKLDNKTKKYPLPTDWGETSSLIHHKTKIFGRDSERDAILDMLISFGDKPESSNKGGAGSSSNQSLSVLPIVGKGGVGKTTLAQLVYNDKQVQENFPLRRWVYVSDDFNVKRIADEMVYSSYNTVRSNASSLEAILTKLQDLVGDQRLLLVLDDVWDETGISWTTLSTVLAYGARGSTVLVTTQNQRVAEVMGTMGPIALDVLNEEDYWQLFKHCAFGDEKLEGEKMEQLQLTGHEIVKKLQGLPLAAEALGRQLRSRLDENYWRNVLDSEWWELDAGLNNILPSLGLSYQHLNQNLKQCFAYCSIFPKGYIFEKQRLVQMWMAQDFIEPDRREKKRMEDIGGEWFDELTDRAFFQCTWNDRFVMHDLMREVAIYVSLDECFILKEVELSVKEKVSGELSIEEGKTGEPRKVPEGIRHFTLISDNLNVFRELSMNKFKNVRTILLFLDYTSDSLKNYTPAELSKHFEKMFIQLKSVRVLDLSHSIQKIDKLSEAVGGLSHLRYLDLSGTKIKQLPKSFSGLCHLQVLNLRSCRIRKLPENMDYLISLRHIYTDADTLSRIARIGKLTSLQELEEFRIEKKKGHGVEELKHMNQIRGYLCINGIDNLDSKERAMEANVAHKHHIENLRFVRNSSKRYGKPDVEKEIFDGLQPHCNLKHLSIIGYGGIASPIWMENSHCLGNLVNINLEYSDKWNSLPPLGQLPSLKVLCMHGMYAIKHVGAQFHGDTGVVFPSLETLKLNDVPAFEGWSDVEVGRRMFPRLREISIQQCPKLNKFPFHHLCLFPTLEVLELINCGTFDRHLSECLQGLTSLSTLRMHCYNDEFSLHLHNLTALTGLDLAECSQLISLEGLQSLVHLKHLIIRGCHKLRRYSHGEDLHNGLPSLLYMQIDENFLLNRGWVHMGSLPSLTEVHIENLSMGFSEEQSRWFQQLPSLRKLFFNHCTNLMKLPDNLVALTTVKELTVSNCPGIQSLPESGLPESLRVLNIGGCQMLGERCTKKTGPDELWSKISCIPCISIDGKIIQKE